MLRKRVRASFYQRHTQHAGSERESRQGRQLVEEEKSLSLV